MWLYIIIVTANGCDSDMLLNYFIKFLQNFISHITIIKEFNMNYIKNTEHLIIKYNYY